MTNHYPHYPPPTLGKRILSVSAVFFGVLIFVFGAFANDALAGLTSAMAIGFPGAWWIHHTDREKKGKPPRDRHWTTVNIACIFIFILGAFITPYVLEMENGSGSTTTTTHRSSARETAT